MAPIWLIRIKFPTTTLCLGKKDNIHLTSSDKYCGAVTAEFVTSRGTLYKQTHVFRYA